MTKDGASTVVSWRADGKEIYFRKSDIPDTLMMAADVSTEPASEPTKPRLLFRSSENSGTSKNISRDGQHFVYVRAAKATPAPETK